MRIVGNISSGSVQPFQSPFEISWLVVEWFIQIHSSQVQPLIHGQLNRLSRLKHVLILVRIFLSHVCFRFRPGKLLRSRIVRVIELHLAPFHPGNDIVIPLRMRASSLDNLRRIGSTKICFDRRFWTRIVTCCIAGRCVPRRQTIIHMSSEKYHISARQLRYHLVRREKSALHVVIHPLIVINERILV